IPLVGLGMAPLRLRSVPLARRSPRWRLAVVAFLAAGGLVVLLLWACFLADYPLTRDVYFTVALLHVLAEVPFLLRALWVPLAERDLGTRSRSASGTYNAAATCLIRERRMDPH